jgi:uncharacterized coiled-coil protein SlyX
MIDLFSGWDLENPMTTAFRELFVTVRQTTGGAHASALNELERVFNTHTARLRAEVANDRSKLETAREFLGAEREALLDAVAEKREAVELDRAYLETVFTRMKEVQPSLEDHFKLNVGGVRYETTRITLTRVPHSMLATMFGARLDMLRRDPKDGSIFLDRDGDRFRLVLDFLRDGGTSQVAQTIRELPGPQQEAMLIELEFYGLADAVFPPWNIEDAEFKFWEGELNSRRYWCAAVLHGRRVLVFGGVDGSGAALNTTEVLDLNACGASTAGPPMATSRKGCAAVWLDARRVLVIGGCRCRAYSAGPHPTSTTEIFDLETMCFSVGPRMHLPRFDFAVVALDVGRVLVAGGGYENRGSHRTTEILDVASMTFAPGPEMILKRSGCSAVALDGKNKVLIVGGASTNTTELLDLDTMAFSYGPRMDTMRHGCAAVPVPQNGGDSQRCLIIGGFDGFEGGLHTKTTEVLDVGTMTFAPGPVMLEGRGGCTAVADAAGRRVLVVSEGGSRKIEVLEATTGQYRRALPRKRLR